LFGVNLGIHFWSNYKRKATVEDLRRAITCQGLIASIHQDLNDTQKQVALLSQVMVEAASGAGADEVKSFNDRLDAISKQIDDLLKLSDSLLYTKVEAFQKTYHSLSGSWRIFYENFGIRHTTAITELAVHGDSLSQRVLQQMLPDLQEAERQRVDAASANFYTVEEFTDRTSVFIFAVSGFVAVLVVFLLSRYLTGALGKLKFGATKIGAGDLDHRIQVESRDELGDLAHGFNEMTDRLLLARTQLTEANQELESRNQEVQKQKQVSDSLLLNILPNQIADELRERGIVEPKYFEDVTILFSDFVGFSLSTERLSAEDLVSMLNDYFTEFDQITSRYGLEKLKTIGDSYMCAGGLPRRTPSHPVDVVMAAFEMVKAVQDRDKPESRVHWAVRIGAHTGPVIAGVVGIKKFAFDIWGETVNYSSRMESSGAPNRVNISERTYSRVKDFIDCEYRGKVLTKEKREFDMYFANGILPNLVDDLTRVPPPAFLRRYHVYFQKKPPSFPAFLLGPEQVTMAPDPLTRRPDAVAT
jgi:class 3 adenylate cyclase